MPFSPEVREKILAAVQQRAPNAKCSLCGRSDCWTIPDGFVSIPLMLDIWLGVKANSTLPCAALICENCGNTHLLNLVHLKLESMAQPDWLPKQS